MALAQDERAAGHVEKFNISLLAQSAFGVPSGDASVDMSLSVGLKTGQAVTEDWNKTMRERVAGYEHARVVDKNRRDVPWNPTFELDILTALWICGFAMGVVTEVAGAPPPYEYEIKEEITTRKLQLTGVVEEGHHEGKRQYNDLSCQSFSITGSGDSESVIDIVSTWRGSGAISKDVTHTSASVSENPRCRMGRIKFELGAFASEVDLTDLLNSFDFGFTNNGFSGHRPGGNFDAVRAEMGNRRGMTFSFEIEQYGVDVMAWVADQTLLSAILTIEDDGGADFIKIELPQIEIMTAVPTSGDQLNFTLTAGILFDPARAGYTAANNAGALITVQRAVIAPQIPLSAMT